MVSRSSEDDSEELRVRSEKKDSREVIKINRIALNNSSQIEDGREDEPISL